VQDELFFAGFSVGEKLRAIPVFPSQLPIFRGSEGRGFR